MYKLKKLKNQNLHKTTIIKQSNSKYRIYCKSINKDRAIAKLNDIFITYF